MTSGLYKRIDAHSGFIGFTDTIGMELGDRGMNKLAFAQEHIPPHLVDVIRQIKAAPKPGMVYLYDRAMGAGESYGPNNNADFFGRDDLIDRHSTFVTHAKVYRHHKHKGPSIGDVVASAYNHPLDCIDLILMCPLSELANDLAQMEGKRMVLGTSMGAKVPYDECSKCGNKARTRAQYCTHLRLQKLQFIDGQQVYAKNPKPTFIDISRVLIPAEPISGVLAKVAHKTAAMTKHILNVERGSAPPKAIEWLASRLPAEDALHTIESAWGTVRPDEFAAIVHKNASLLQPGVIVQTHRVPMRRVRRAGAAHHKIAQELSEHPCVEASSEREFWLADEDTKIAYERWRSTDTSPAYRVR